MALDKFQICEQDLPSKILEQYLQASALAIDTETMGLIPHRDRLCLVQISDATGLVTAIKIAKGQTSAPNLAQLLVNENITKIFHFC